MSQLLAAAPFDEPAGLSGWAASTLAAAGLGGDGLYVATSSAGAQEAVAFYREGIATGLAFANPRRFPWALANSATGAIARALDIRGPTYTLMGGSSAVEAAFEQVADDIEEGLIAVALIVALEAAIDGLALAAVALTGGVVPVVPTCSSAAAALRHILSRSPELQLPGLSGHEQLGT